MKRREREKAEHKEVWFFTRHALFSFRYTEKKFFQRDRKMNVISLCREKKRRRRRKEMLRHKEYCQSSQRHRQKNFRVLKTHAHITYHLTVVNQEVHIQ